MLTLLIGWLGLRKTRTFTDYFLGGRAIGDLGAEATVIDGPFVIAGVRVLVVDDASPDGTGAIADAIAASQPERIAVLHRVAKTGLGDAYVAGFRVALASGAERIFEMDADFSHPVGAIPEMLQLAELHDVVVGSRYVPGGSLDRRWSRGRRSR